MDYANFGSMATRMGKLMASHVVDPELYPWIMPSFSTTTSTDTVVASIIMMGALQKYFAYGFGLTCGIPTVTLLGVREDWQEILHRLEKLPNLGAEAAQFYTLLKPVLTHMVSTFDSPDSAETKAFWRMIADQSSGSGPFYLSGWITAFCFWNQDGKSLYAPRGEPPSGPVEIQGFNSRAPGCNLDGTLYHRVDLDAIPSGHSAVPVKLDDNGDLYDTIMVAGSMGIRANSSGEPLASETSTTDDSAPQASSRLDSIQAESGWFMFERVGEPEQTDAEVGKVKPQSSDRTIKPWDKQGVKSASALIEESPRKILVSGTA